MKTNHIILTLFISLLFMSCDSEKSLTYLGQKPPGLVPELFAPDIIRNEFREGAYTYSADLKEFYFRRRGGKYKHNTLVVVKYQDNEYSTHYIRMASRVEILSEKFDFSKIQSFFEIGGGFGANINFLVTNFPNIKRIIYLDAVPNIYVGTEYLRHHFNDQVKDYLFTKEKKEIEFSNNDELEIICIPPWEIEKINAKIDHFHNAASFVEMPKKVIENYVKFIKKFEIKDISLMSYDNYDLSTTFDPSHLSNFFDNKLNIFWKDHFIKEYNEREIYLIS